MFKPSRILADTSVPSVGIVGSVRRICSSKLCLVVLQAAGGLLSPV